MENKIYEKVTIEISNVCNAHCKWCTTGMYNQQGTQDKCFMSREEFKRGLEYLIENSIIDKNTVVELYNWGEPFLNPQLNEILEEINKVGLRYHLSTNGTKFVEFKEETLKNLDYLVFSMPGFSQSSYDKIHKVNFHKVLNNIKETAKEFKKIKCNHKIMVNYHIYQFNLDEIEEAKRFCDEIEIEFIPTLAYFNDFDLFNEYVKGDITKDNLMSAAQDLFLNFYEPLKAEAPKEYICPEHNFLVLSRNFEIIPCCRLTEKDSLGNLFECKLKDIVRLKSNISKCQICNVTKQHYIIHHEVLLPKWCKSNTDKSKELEEYRINLQTAIKQREALSIQLQDYEINLKQAIEQRNNISMQLEEYNKNLQLAIKQRDNAISEMEEYSRNLQMAISQREDAKSEVEEYMKNLQIAIKQRDIANEQIIKYDSNLKITLAQKEHLEKELNMHISGKNIISEELNKCKDEMSILKEEILSIKSSKLYKLLRKFDKQLK